MDIFERIRNLNLPVSEYVVFGSGPLAAHGIRESNDLDLFVTDKLYKKLKKNGWTEKSWSDAGYYLEKDGVQMDDSWNYGKYRPTFNEIIDKAKFINGIPFAPLTEVIKWKKAFARPKDMADIKLIESYLADKQ